MGGREGGLRGAQIIISHDNIWNITNISFRCNWPPSAVSLASDFGVTDDRKQCHCRQILVSLTTVCSVTVVRFWCH